MTIEEIKAICPEADVYALREDMPYLVVVDRNQINMQIVQSLSVCLDAASMGAIIIAVDNPATAVRLLEVKP